jgi:hypothetical protein
MNSTSIFYLVARDTIGDLDLVFLPSSNLIAVREQDQGEVETAEDMSNI